MFTVADVTLLCIFTTFDCELYYQTLILLMFPPGMEYPQLFHLLPCEYNYQLDIIMGTQKLFAKDFNKYHYCRYNKRHLISEYETKSKIK